DESMPVNDKVDVGEKFIHEPEVQVLKMTLCRRWQPGKNTGYQHETHKEQGHVVDACDDTELAKNRNVSGQERQESDGYREVGEKGSESHLFHHGRDCSQLVFCSRKLQMILVQ